MKLEDRLKEIRKRLEEIKKKVLEEQKKETQKLIESLNLQKIFNDKKRFNELNFILNNTTKKIKLSKEFLEDSQKIGKNFNSVFNYMDNGKLDKNAKSQLSLKPILLKLFDDNKDNEVNKEVDDKFGKDSSVFDILNQSFKGKLVFDEKGNLLLDDNKKAEKIEKEFDDKKEVKEIEKVENSSSSSNESESNESESNNNEQKQKNRNSNKLRYR